MLILHLASSVETKLYFVVEPDGKYEQSKPAKNRLGTQTGQYRCSLVAYRCGKR